MDSPVRADGVTTMWVTSVDGQDHLVTDSVLARSPDGRYLARCGRFVLSASLTAAPGSPCVLCFPYPGAWAGRR